SGALIAIPVKRLGMFMDVLIAATRAYYAFRPAVALKVEFAGVFIRKLLFELDYTHLVNTVVQGFRGLFHGLSPINLEPVYCLINDLSSRGQSPYLNQE